MATASARHAVTAVGSRRWLNSVNGGYRRKRHGRHDPTALRGADPSSGSSFRDHVMRMMHALQVMHVMRAC